MAASGDGALEEQLRFFTEHGAHWIEAHRTSLRLASVPLSTAVRQQLFGFYSTMAKFASLLGPAVLWLVWTFGDDPRRGILAIAGFFLVGGFLLSGVDVKKGQAMASSEAETA